MNKKAKTLTITTNKLRKYEIEYNDGTKDTIFAKFTYYYKGIVEFRRHEFTDSDSTICYIPLTSIRKITPTEEWKDEIHPYKEKRWILEKHAEFLYKVGILNGKYLEFKPEYEGNLIWYNKLFGLVKYIK